MKQSSDGAIAQPELCLLLACARTPNSITDGTAIRRMLEDGIDWTLFARKAIYHGVAGLVGAALEEIAPDMVPDDLLDALRMNKEYIRSRNNIIAEEIRRAAMALVKHGVHPIWFKGPVLGIQAYGDLNVRMFGPPTLLVPEQEVAATITALSGIGYRQQADLTAAQLDFIRYLRGHEILTNRSAGVRADVYTRLTPINMAINIDHKGLWRRARSVSILGQTVQAMAPEDEVLASSMRDPMDRIWRLGEACDFAGLIASHRNLDWGAITKRSRAQGCLRMLLLAVSLARRYFGASITDESLSTVQTDPLVETMVSRTVARWHVDGPSESTSGDGFSLELLRLHDGSIRKARYLVRSLVLPTSSHVSRIALPRRFTNLFVYALSKAFQDIAILPLLRTFRRSRAQARRLRDQLASHELGLVIVPVSSSQRLLLRRHNAARAAAERVVAENPTNGAAWEDLGDALFRLKRHQSAVAAYDKALETMPENLVLWRKRAAALVAGGRRLSRLSTEEETFNHEDADAWARHAASLGAAKRFAEAVTAADRALSINPTNQVATRVALRSRILSCDWRRSDEDERRVAEAFNAGLALLTPAGNRAICDSEEQNLIAAQLWARPFVLPQGSLPRGRKYLHERIRLAYLCSEYHDHPAGRQIVGVLEQHNRLRFETTAISLGGPNSSAIRRRIQDACDRFIDVHHMNDDQIADTIREMEIDIAIDLDRFAARARPGILARRPAALQVTYFGNAGTTGSRFFDYIIGDRTLIPREHFRYYTEKVIYLPNSYQCNDAERHVPRSTLSRVEAGLPEAGFVYCCFNQNYKIRPPVFDVWMRLLHACSGSVLWLLGGDPYATHNLRREAAARGIAPDRIVFAPVVPNDDHLARHRLADLFLDTLPCNAHATASDALWAGLPIVTCLGNTFAGRVGASLLRAVDLPELVTESLAQYEELATSLARDSQRLAGIKSKLARNRDTKSLFDTVGFTRDLEAAFDAIWRRHQADLAPEAIAV